MPLHMAGWSHASVADSGGSARGLQTPRGMLDDLIPPFDLLPSRAQAAETSSGPGAVSGESPSELRRRLREIELQNDELRTICNVTGLAIVSVDRDGSIGFVSASAEALLGETRHADLRSGRLWLRDERLRRRFASILREDGDAEHLLCTEDGNLVPALLLRVVRHDGDRRTVFVSAPTRVRRPSLRRVAAQLQLTPTEARVAVEIANGHSVEEIAHGLRIQRSTVRTHLKSIRQKTGARRQTEIVRLVLTVESAFD